MFVRRAREDWLCAEVSRLLELLIRTTLLDGKTSTRPVLELEGNPDSAVQQILYEQGTLAQLVMPIIARADTSDRPEPDKWFSAALSPRHRRTSLNRFEAESGSPRPEKEIVRLCYKLLSAACKRHKGNQMIVGRHIQTLLDHIGKKLKAEDALQQLCSNNIELIQAIPDEVVPEAFKLLQVELLLLLLLLLLQPAAL